jgi:hypothetical protein
MAYYRDPGRPRSPVLAVAGPFAAQNRWVPDLPTRLGIIVGPVGRRGGETSGDRPRPSYLRSPPGHFPFWAPPQSRWVGLFASWRRPDVASPEDTTDSERQYIAPGVVRPGRPR